MSMQDYKGILWDFIRYLTKWLPHRFRTCCYYFLRYCYFLLLTAPSLCVILWGVILRRNKDFSDEKTLLLVTDYTLRKEKLTDKANELWGEGLAEQQWLNSGRICISSPRSLAALAKYIVKNPLAVICYSPSENTYFSSPFWNLLKLLKFKVLFLITDSSSAVEQHIQESWGSGARGIVIDMPVEPMPDEWKALKKFTFLFSPFSQRKYCDPGGVRDINCSFVGEINNGFAERREAVEMMKQKNVPFFTTGGFSNPVSTDEMIRIYQHSKIVIDFSETTAEFYQLKGRVIEAMLCGAVVMTRRTPAVNRYLKPGVEYIPYDDIREIPDIAVRCLSEPDKLEAVRKAGSETAKKIFRTDHFWKTAWSLAVESGDKSKTGQCVQALILAGGMGTRLQSVVGDRQKVVADVDGKPFISILLKQLYKAGVRSVVLCVGHKAETVEKAVQGAFPGMEILFSLEDTPRGTAGAVQLALEKCRKDELLILNGDSYLDADLNHFLNVWHEKQSPFGMLLKKMADTSRYGRVVLDPEGRVKAFEEKKENSGSGFINAGIYVCKREFLAGKLVSGKGSLEKEYFPCFAAEAQIAGVVSEGDFIDIGTPESYAAAQRFFKEDDSCDE